MKQGSQSGVCSAPIAASLYIVLSKAKLLHDYPAPTKKDFCSTLPTPLKLIPNIQSTYQRKKKYEGIFIFQLRTKEPQQFIF